MVKSENKTTSSRRKTTSSINSSTSEYQNEKEGNIKPFTNSEELEQVNPLTTSSESNTNSSSVFKTIPIEIGLDASTTTVGVSIINSDTGELILLTYLDLSSKAKYEDIFEKIEAAREYLASLLRTNNWTLKDVHVEEYVKQFTPGFSSADTLFTLAIFNHSLCQYFYDKHRIKPNKINVRSVRKNLGINVDYKDKTKSTKQKVFDIVRNENPNFPWFTYIAKSGKNKDQSVYGKQNEDMADAWVVGFGGWLSKSPTRIYEYQKKKNMISHVTKINRKTKQVEEHIVVLNTNPNKKKKK